MFRLALALGKTMTELDNLSMTELMEWVAYFEYLDEQKGEQ